MVTTIVPFLYIHRTFLGICDTSTTASKIRLCVNIQNHSHSHFEFPRLLVSHYVVSVTGVQNSRYLYGNHAQ